MEENNDENIQSVAIDEETKKELEKRKKSVFKFFLYSILVVTIVAAGVVVYNLCSNLNFDVKNKFFESSIVDSTLNDEIINIESNDNQQTEQQTNIGIEDKKNNNDKNTQNNENNNISNKASSLYHVIAFSSHDKKNVQKCMKKFKSKDFECTLLENNGNIRLSIKSFDKYQDAKKFVKKCKIKYKTLCKDIWILNPDVA